MHVKPEHNVKHTVSTPIATYFKEGLEKIRPNVTPKMRLPV